MNIVNRTLLAAGAIAFTVVAASAQILPLDNPDSLTITGPNNFLRTITVAPGGEFGVSSIANLDLPQGFFGSAGVVVLVDPGSGLALDDTLTINAVVERGALSDAFGFFEVGVTEDNITAADLEVVPTVVFGFVSDVTDALTLPPGLTTTTPITFLPEDGNGTYSGDRFLSTAAVEAGYHITFSSDVENVPDTAVTAMLFAIGLGGLALVRRKVATCS